MNRKLGLEDLIPYGKFKGTKMRVLIMNETAYVKWLIDNTNLNLDNQAFEMLEKVVGE